MSGVDNIVINLLERAASQDINDLQSVKDRAFLETLKYLFASHGFVSKTTQTVVRSVVAGGLEVTSSGSSVTIGPGVLFQQSTTLAPVPGALDSSYRFGHQMTPSVVSSVAASQWHLIEAQVVDQTTETTSRDIFDPVTKTFSPQNVPKRKERRLAFQVGAQVTNIPAPTGSDWVPIAAFLTDVGSNVISLVDLRPLYSEMVSSNRKVGGYVRNQSRGNLAGFVNGSDVIAIDVETHTAGARVFCSPLSRIGTEVLLPYDEPGIRATGYTPSDGDWQYWYLGTWFGLTPRGYDANRSVQGVLFTSNQGPVNNNTRTAPSGITLPAPFGEYSTSDAAQDAVCVYLAGMNVGAGYCTGGQMDDSGHLRYMALFDLNGAGTSPIPFSTSCLAFFGGNFPNGTKAYDVWVDAVGAGGGGDAVILTGTVGGEVLVPIGASGDNTDLGSVAFAAHGVPRANQSGANTQITETTATMTLRVWLQGVWI